MAPKKPIGFVQQTTILIGPLPDVTSLETKHFFKKNHFGDFVSASSFASAVKTGLTSPRVVGTSHYWNMTLSVSYFTYQLFIDCDVNRANYILKIFIICWNWGTWFLMVLMAFICVLRGKPFVPGAVVTLLWLSAFESLCFALFRSSSMKINFIFDSDIFLSHSER